MTQPTAANAKLVDKNNVPQIGNQQNAISALTQSPAGTPDGSSQLNANSLSIAEIQDDFATIIEIVNLIVETLEAHGLIADN